MVSRPVVEFAMGLRDVWEAYCSEHGIKSQIVNFKDNRFNGLFEVSSAICKHHSDFVKLLKASDLSNGKVKGLLKDLQDPHLMAILGALAMLFVKITGPFWTVVTTTSYIGLHQVIPNLKQDLLDLQTGVIPAHSAEALPSLLSCTDMNKLSDIMQSIDITNSTTLSAFSRLCGSFLKTFEAQLTDFTDGTVELMAEDTSLSFAPATNLVVERNFGVLDASQKRRPSASLLYHSSIHLIKQGRHQLEEHLTPMHPEERRGFFKNIRKAAKGMLKRHRQHDKQIKSEILAKLQKQKVSKKLVAKAKKTKTNKDQKLHRLTAKLPSNDALKAGRWVAVAFEDTWYPGLLTEIDIASRRHTVDFAYPCKRAGDFKWPDGKDLQAVEQKFILCADLDLICRGGGRIMTISQHKDVTALFQAFKQLYF